MHRLVHTTTVPVHLRVCVPLYQKQAVRTSACYRRERQVGSTATAHGEDWPVCSWSILESNMTRIRAMSYPTGPAHYGLGMQVEHVSGTNYYVLCRRYAFRIHPCFPYPL